LHFTLFYIVIFLSLIIHSLTSLSYIYPSSTSIYTLSLHDALPISAEGIDFMEYYGRQMIRLGQGREINDRPGENNTFFYQPLGPDRKSTRLNSSHVSISYAVFCLKKKTKKYISLGFLIYNMKRIES